MAISNETGNLIWNVLAQIDDYIALHLSDADADAIDFLDTIVDRLVSRIEDRQWDINVAKELARNEATRDELEFHPYRGIRTP